MLKPYCFHINKNIYLTEINQIKHFHSFSDVNNEMPPSTQRGNTHTHETHPSICTHTCYFMTCLLLLLTETDETPRQTQRVESFSRVDLFQELTLLKLGNWKKIF